MSLSLPLLKGMPWYYKFFQSSNFLCFIFVSMQLFPKSETKYETVNVCWTFKLGSMDKVPSFSRWRLPNHQQVSRTSLCSLWPPSSWSESPSIVGGESIDESLEVCRVTVASESVPKSQVNRQQYNVGCIKLLIVLFQISSSMFPKCWVLSKMC